MSDPLESIRPVEHGFTSRAATVTGQGLKGMLLGLPKGLIGGGIIGGLGTALLVGAALFTGGMLVVGAWGAAAGLAGAGSAIGAMTGAAGVVGMVSAIAGAFSGIFGAGMGSFAGGVFGPVAGLFKGIGRGRDIVKSEQAMADVLKTQNNIAAAQMETARGMQAMAMASVVSQMPQPANRIAVPSSVYQGAKPIYVGAGQGASAVERYTTGKMADQGLAQMVENQAATAAVAEKQV